jgi:pyrroloquinoline quinone biosynthesis protein B
VPEKSGTCFFIGGKEMFLKILGSAAGGGFPQWNCACLYCQRVRTGDQHVHARMHNSLAVSADGKSWCLINASPDVRVQIESHPALLPGPSLRSIPIEGILLTDAELDHTIGILSLRESAELEVYATSPVLNALTGSFPIRHILEPYAKLHWNEVKSGDPFNIFGGKLIIRPFFLGCKPPRYASVKMNKAEGKNNTAWVIGYRIEDPLTRGVAVYAPCVELWTDELEKQLEDADCIFIDGTFWHADELRHLGVSALGAVDMGHVPIEGSNGSLYRLAKVSAQRKIYTHINNTNPILDEESIECRSLKEYGIEVGYDGLELEV